MPRTRNDEKKSTKIRLPIETQSFCHQLQPLNQKDLLKHILSFLRIASLYSDTQFAYSPIYGISHYMRRVMQPRDTLDEETYLHAFNVLPVSFKTINKTFNAAVIDLSHIIVSIQTKLDLNLFSLSPQCDVLKELYLIQDIYDLNGREFAETNKRMNDLKCTNLRILQIHLHRNSRSGLNLVLRKENLPKLQHLILGTAHKDAQNRQMKIDQMNLDLNIRELRIQYCTIDGLDSLRFSLARCSLIERLFLMFPMWNDAGRIMLHSLCMLSVTEMFIQCDLMPQLSIYAPNLRLIQFYFCDILDQLILLNRMPNQLRKYMRSVDTNVSRINTQRELLIGFDNTHHELVQRHMPNFTVIQDGSVQCYIKFTCLCRQMLLWPFDTY